MSKKWASTNSGVTALTIEPLSKEPNSFCHWSWLWLCFQTYSNKWVGLSSWRKSVVISSCTRHLIWGCPLRCSQFVRAQAPFFAITSFMCKYAFWVGLLTSFGQSHMKWSVLPHPKQFLFFFWYNSTAFVKWVMYLTYQSASFTLPDASTSWSGEGPVSSSPWFHTWILFCHTVSNGCSLRWVREIGSLATENA